MVLSFALYLITWAKRHWTNFHLLIAWQTCFSALTRRNVRNSPTHILDQQLSLCHKNIRELNEYECEFSSLASLQASHYHVTYPSHPMSYPLYLKPTWRARALETSLVWNSKVAVILNLLHVVQSKGPYCVHLDGNQTCSIPLGLSGPQHVTHKSPNKVRSCLVGDGFNLAHVPES